MCKLSDSYPIIAPSAENLQHLINAVAEKVYNSEYVLESWEDQYCSLLPKKYAAN